MAKPNKKDPTKTVNIFCAKCRSQLFKYRKGGTGSLVKGFKERITQDFTNESCVCPTCNSTFARETLIRGVLAFKIIGEKVSVK